MEIARGDIVVGAVTGDFGGKPRPAVVVHSDLFNPTHASIMVCPITTVRLDTPLFRVDLEPCEANGLNVRSQVMADKIVATRRDKISRRIGSVNDSELREIDRALQLMLGFSA